MKTISQSFLSKPEAQNEIEALNFELPMHFKFLCSFFNIDKLRMKRAVLLSYERGFCTITWRSHSGARVLIPISKKKTPSIDSGVKTND